MGFRVRGLGFRVSRFCLIVMIGLTVSFLYDFRFRV